MPVYFVQAGDDGPIKIGFAIDVRKRIATLQAGNHVPLIILREIPGSRTTEAWLHRFFVKRRIVREWFEPCAEMLTIWPPELNHGRSRRGDIEPILQRAGGVARVAREFGISSQAISQWRRCPAQRVRMLSALSGVPLHEIRPDVYAAA